MHVSRKGSLRYSGIQFLINKHGFYENFIGKIDSIHSWQYSYKRSVLLWVGLLASEFYYFIQERTSKKFWTYILIMVQKWPLLEPHICILHGKIPKCQISYVQTGSGNATHLNSLSMTILTVGKKLGFPKFPERAFQALQSY